MSASQNVQAQIRATLGANASSLVSVPEIEGDSTKDAIRKLQVQIFVLSDAIADLSKRLDAATG